ncbi:uncharacterized protein LOC124144834 isoform X2 [Haliotis rufescens]|uniref:uncharacterized protein LOC124144834 isoform X2 n=1 Tax=Haliotis rufescens TaxID=6454 RepID=UPI001EAFB32E|nr:uncharacterized protein LOC124144834 isoform X2 [Haliotis rufescens]
MSTASFKTISSVGDMEVRDLWTDGDCQWNCSGHGACQQGQCVCLVQYAGTGCEEVNRKYFLAFGSIFTCVCCVVTIQLLLCIVCEYQREKKSWRSACGVTVQKLLYLLVICASALRGAYFLCKWRVSEYVASCLWSGYFPFLITGFSLIICSWAEDVHVNRSQTPRFLSKSVLAFVLFNVVLYLLLCTVLLLTEIVPNDEDLHLKAYNGAVAVLLIILVVIFLIYGVELYFKVHGAFMEDGVELDPHQVAMSRLGLLSQAFLQFLMGIFLVTDVITDHWKNVMTILELNYYDLVFRVVEFGVVIWFPCVLWNYRKPETLWVLNPRRILRTLDLHSDVGERTALCPDQYTSGYSTFKREDSVASSLGQYDCWICYDPDRTDAGPLLQPCACRGDVATVHHNCLHKWLVENAEHEHTPTCKVCNVEYRVQYVSTWLPRGMGSRRLAILIVLLLSMLGSPVLSYFICHLDTYIYLKILITGSTVILELFALKVLSVTLVAIGNRVRVASMKIIGKEMTKPDPETKRRTTLVRQREVTQQHSEASGELKSQCTVETHAEVHR